MGTGFADFDSGRTIRPKNWKRSAWVGREAGKKEYVFENSLLLKTYEMVCNFRMD